MREVWVNVAGVRLFAADDGNGPAVVMLHGGLANHQVVLPILTPLSARYRIVAPDLRGSGRSWSPEHLTFDRLADDLVSLLDQLDIKGAVVGGISSGSGVAVGFALRHPGRTRGLVVARPVYAGAGRGYTASQRAAFTAMDSVAGRALEEGIEVLRPLYERLPEAFRERAWAVASKFDPASVVATSRFIAAGDQPFSAESDLRSLRMPTLLIRGDDPQHPAEVSDVYAEHVSDCRVLPADTLDLAAAISAFCEGLSESPD